MAIRINLPQTIGKGYCVYKHTTPSGKHYIGITRLSPNIRWDGGRGYNEQVFGRAVLKYGWDNISHEILAQDLTKEEACRQEQTFIQQLNTQHVNYGYNVSNGGETNSMSLETRAKLSAGRIGRKYPNTSATKMGHTVDTITRDKIREAVKQRWAEGCYPPKICKEETKQKIRAANLGKVLSAETRQKQSAALRANPPVVRKCVCVETNQVFSSCAEAERFTGHMNPQTGNINACCRGDQKTAYKLTWRYA